MTPSIPLSPQSSRNKKKISKHGENLKKWFLNLNPEERGRVLSFEDKDGIILLRNMYNTKKKEGDGLFFAVDDPILPKIKEKAKKFINFNSNFCFKKLSSLLNNTLFYHEKLLIYDRKLEESVRLCDTREYLDTISISGNLLQDGEKFLNLMEVVTRGGFLTEPCRVYWDNANKNWVWDPPKWFKDMGYYTLGTFISHKFEQALWLRYWDAYHLDPRKKPCSLNYIFPNYLEGLLSKTYLINFWKDQTPQERRKIVGSIGDIVQHVLTTTNNNIENENNKSVAPNRHIYNTTNKFSYYFLNNNQSIISLDYPKLLSALVDLSIEEKNIELLFTDSDLTQNEKTFIEILYFSPLDRAGSYIDMILRRIGLSIHSAYTEKLSINLIVGEEAEKIKKVMKDESKKRRKKKKKMKIKEKKKEQFEKEQKEKDLKEKEEKQKKEKERQLQEQKRKQKEIQKNIYSLFLDILNQAESIIIKKKENSNLSDQILSTQKKKKKKKNKKQNLKEEKIKNDFKLKNHKENDNQKNKQEQKNLKQNYTKQEKVCLEEKEKILIEEKNYIKQENSLRKENIFIQRQNQQNCDVGLPYNYINKIIYPHYPLNFFCNFKKNLHQEILNFYSQTKLIIEKDFKPQVKSMIERVNLVVKSIWSNAIIKIYGSYATSLCIPSSDLDLVILGKFSYIIDNNKDYSPIQMLANKLKKSNWVQSVQAIETARVPVIKLKSFFENIHTDITFNEDSLNCYIPPSSLSTNYLNENNSYGFKHCGRAACELIKKYIKEMNYVLPPLVLVLKQFLYEKGLNNTYTGGLGSYCLVLMVISFLQSKRFSGNNIFNNDNKAGFEEKGKFNLGILLLEFLELYGKKFDYNNMGISISTGSGYFYLNKYFPSFSPAPLVIVDPFNPTNNLGINVFGMWKVKAAFAEAHTTLVSSIIYYQNIPSLLNCIIHNQPFINYNSILTKSITIVQ